MLKNHSIQYSIQKNFNPIHSNFIHLKSSQNIHSKIYSFKVKPIQKIIHLKFRAAPKTKNTFIGENFPKSLKFGLKNAIFGVILGVFWAGLGLALDNIYRKFYRTLNNAKKKRSIQYSIQFF